MKIHPVEAELILADGWTDMMSSCACLRMGL